MVCAVDMKLRNFSVFHLGNQGLQNTYTLFVCYVSQYLLPEIRLYMRSPPHAVISRLLIAISHSSRCFASFVIKEASLNKSQMKKTIVAMRD